MNNIDNTDVALHDLDTKDRVRAHTAPVANARIDDVTARNVERTAGGGPIAVGRRLAQLDAEWDIDRALMANFSLLGGLAYAVSQRRRRLPSFMRGRVARGASLLFRAQLAFLLLHAVVGWCPPASLLRRLGFRTAREIDVERRALIEARRAHVMQRQEP